MNTNPILLAMQKEYLTLLSNPDGTLTVGSGITMFGLEQWLNEYGYSLMNRNDGGYGPTLGGYISAGGISNQSGTYGGLHRKNCIGLLFLFHKINYRK